MDYAGWTRLFCGNKLISKSQWFRLLLLAKIESQGPDLPSPTPPETVKTTGQMTRNKGLQGTGHQTVRSERWERNEMSPILVPSLLP